VTGDCPPEDCSAKRTREPPASAACAAPDICLACELLRCAGGQSQDTMTDHVPPPAQSAFTGSGAAGSAQSFTGIRERQAARAAAPGRRGRGRTRPRPRPWLDWADWAPRASPRPPLVSYAAGLPPGPDSSYYSRSSYVLVRMIVKQMTHDTYADQPLKPIITPLRLHSLGYAPHTCPAAAAQIPAGYFFESAGKQSVRSTQRVRSRTKVLCRMPCRAGLLAQCWLPGRSAWIPVSVPPGRGLRTCVAAVR